MKAEQIIASEDFKRCEAFHGHICPGLSIGYRAAGIALEELKAQRAADEEIVAVVETDACCADAIQVLTGCTFGKGNFIYKDYGKVAFTFYSRDSGKGIRVAMRPGGFALDGEHQELLQQVAQGQASEDTTKRFRQLHYQRSLEVLEKPAEDLFIISDVTMPLPEKAKIEPSELCDTCGEPVMASKLMVVNGKKQCRQCAASV